MEGLYCSSVGHTPDLDRQLPLFLRELLGAQAKCRRATASPPADSLRRPCCRSLLPWDEILRAHKVCGILSVDQRNPDRRGCSAKCKAPIYTLNVLSKKLYVVTSPELVAAVSRNSKSLSFNPFISEIGMRLTRPDEPTRAIIKDNINGERGQWGYVLEVHDLTVTALGPGKDLDLIAHAMLVQTAAHLQSSDAKFAKRPIKLYAWSRHLFTMCSTAALYGPDNPFNTQPELEEAFW